MKRLCLFLPLLACGLVGCASKPASHPSICLPKKGIGENAALITAARQYLQANSAASVGETTIVPEQFAAGYARLRVTPVKPTTDPATLYMRRAKSGTWEGVSIGTGWSPEDYNDLHIPKSLRN